MEQVMIAQRNPYNTGMPVRGQHFYGRTKLIEQLLAGPDRNIWVVGGRRIGKTSLLARTAEIAEAAGQVAFNIGIDAAETVADLAACFLEDLEDSDPRLQRLGLTLAALQDKAPADLIRALDRAGRDHGVEVVILLDEGEALIGIARRDDQILKDLQHVIQRTQALRVIVAATRRLLELDEICKSWDTTRFLDPVAPYYLGSLERDESLALLRQKQAPAGQTIDDAIAAAIIDATGGHPYLLQSFASSLWNDGVVRMPVPEDLIPPPDSNWSRMFQQDYECLSDNERRIVRGFADDRPLTEAEVATLLGAEIQPNQARALLASLSQMCYVRRDGESYRIGNQLFRSWLGSGQAQEPEPCVSNEIAADLADEEQQSITAQIANWLRQRYVLEEQHAQLGLSTPPHVLTQIENINQKVAELEKRLGELRVHR
jgi:hypothetical protein